ncbi:MAG: hypothetical protein H6692_01705 [Gemmatimonadales bacterium]|nr:hypothetical protein [Gemmatimonadales bacterium]MCB9518439.1 hypothetical protein [Gemmatimonadales bacterium]
MAFARDVAEDHGVSAFIDAEAAKNPRLRDLFDGLIWRLARDPECGEMVAGTDGRWVVRSEVWPGMPGVLVLAYRFDDEKVELSGAKLVPIIQGGDKAQAA